jgi:hypothetical protein
VLPQPESDSSRAPIRGAVAHRTVRSVADLIRDDAPRGIVQRRDVRQLGEIAPVDPVDLIVPQQPSRDRFQPFVQCGDGRRSSPRPGRHHRAPTGERERHGVVRPFRVQVQLDLLAGTPYERDDPMEILDAEACRKEGLDEEGAVQPISPEDVEDLRQRVLTGSRRTVDVATKSFRKRARSIAPDFHVECQQDLHDSTTRQP